MGDTDAQPAADEDAVRVAVHSDPLQARIAARSHVTDKPLGDVWTERDFPVLVEVVHRIDSGGASVRAEDVAKALGMPVEDVRRAGSALQRRGLVKVQGAAELPVIFFFDVSGEAYVLTGLHPDGDDVAQRLASALQQAADRTDDPEERGRLKRAAGAVGELVGTVGAGVMTAYLTSLLPGQ